MAFSLAGTINTGSYTDNWRDFLDNYLANMDGWTVSAHPGGNADYRVFNFQFTCLLTGKTRSTDPTLGFWFFYTGSNDFYEDQRYTTTPGDTGVNSSNSVEVYSGASKWKVWTSDDNNGSIFVTGGGDTGRDFVFWWPHAEWLWWNNTDWLPGVDSENGCVCPASKASGALRYMNKPLTTGNSSAEYWAAPGLGNWTVGYGIQHDLYYKKAQIRAYTASTAYSIQTGNMLCNDTISFDPTSDSGQVDVTDATWSIISDGVNYYWRSNGDLTSRALLFDMGTTDPDTVGI